MNIELTWQTLCFALSINKATVGNGGIYYQGRVYRQTADRKGLEWWDSKKPDWVKLRSGSLLSRTG